MKSTKRIGNLSGAASSPWEGATEMAVFIVRVRRDERLQVRKKLDPGTVKRYAAIYQSEKAMPPVKIAVINEVPVLIDGWHRLAALEELGVDKASALVIQSSDLEARWLAAAANLEHGLPLKVAELRAVFRAFVRAKKHRNGRGQLLSYRQIGQTIGKPHTTVRSWMIADFPKIAAEYGGDEGFVGKGGLKQPEITPSSTLQDAKEALAKALDTFRSIDCPEQRSTVIEAAEQTLREMKDAGNWHAREF